MAIAPRLLDGLVYLHRVRRTIHRDIKPSNLLIDVHGCCKISDFGVSGELQSSLSKCAPRPSNRPSTPPSSPPPPRGETPSARRRPAALRRPPLSRLCR